MARNDTWQFDDRRRNPQHVRSSRLKQRKPGTKREGGCWLFALVLTLPFVTWLKRR